MKNKILKTIGIFFLIITAVSFTVTTYTMETPKGKWVSLFDGKTLKGWHGFNKTGTIQNWTIEDGAMVCLGAAADAHGGDIVTDEAFENFELKWEWKISKAGNSGVMYHVVEGAKYEAPYQTGPEYQLIDDIGFPQKLEDWQKTGADYAMNLTNKKKKLKPVGQWNTSKIIFNKGHAEHWLNGQKIVEFQAWDAAWTKKKTEGKWKDFPDYGSAKKGLIALQDHGQKAYFKNIMIKVL
ncbi:3-keto-disaccharide hydrolase [Ferruginibacter sp.]